MTPRRSEPPAAETSPASKMPTASPLLEKKSYSVRAFVCVPSTSIHPVSTPLGRRCSSRQRLTFTRKQKGRAEMATNDAQKLRRKDSSCCATSHWLEWTRRYWFPELYIFIYEVNYISSVLPSIVNGYLGVSR